MASVSSVVCVLSSCHVLGLYCVFVHRSCKRFSRSASFFLLLFCVYVVGFFYFLFVHFVFFVCFCFVFWFFVVIGHLCLSCAFIIFLVFFFFVFFFLVV